MATSNDLMLILNQSDREKDEVLTFFKDFVKSNIKDGIKFTKKDIAFVTKQIKKMDSGDELTCEVIEIESRDNNVDGICKFKLQTHDKLLGKYDWGSDDGFEVYAEYVKHCQCRENEKYGSCDCDPC